MNASQPTPIDGKLQYVKDRTYKHMTKQQFITQIVDKYAQYIKYDEKINKLFALACNFLNSKSGPQNKEEAKMGIQVVDFNWKPPQLKATLVGQITINSEGTLIMPSITSYTLLLSIKTREMKPKYNHVYLGFISDSVLYPETPLKIKSGNIDINDKILRLPTPLLFSYDLKDGVYASGHPSIRIRYIFYGGACQGRIANSKIKEKSEVTVYSYLNGVILQTVETSGINVTITEYKNRLISRRTLINNGIVELSHEDDDENNPHGEYQ